MAGFRSVKKYAQAWEDGRVFTSHSRDQATYSPSNVLMVDLSYFGGGPPANYYASTPATAATLDGTTGIYHGDDKSPAAKYLVSVSLTSLTSVWAGEFHLLDYLLYYPFFDGDDLSAQPTVNSVTMPRYTSGDGVMVIAVCQSPGPGSGSFTFDYVNQNGDAKTSPVQYCSAFAASAGSLLFGNSAAAGSAAGTGSFCVLGAGDTGCRSITGVNVLSSIGGLFALVLVKPITTLVLREGACQSEKSFVTSTAPPPRIYDGAYLNWISRLSGSIQNIPIAGTYTFIWDEGT